MKAEIERLAREGGEARARQEEHHEDLRQELRTLGRTVSRLEERQRSLEERHDVLMHLLLDTQTQLGDQIEQAVAQVRHLEREWLDQNEIRERQTQRLNGFDEALEECTGQIRNVEDQLEQRTIEIQEQAEAVRVELDTGFTERVVQLDAELRSRIEDLGHTFEEQQQETRLQLVEGVAEQGARQDECLARLDILQRDTTGRLEDLDSVHGELRTHVIQLEHERFAGLVRQMSHAEQGIVELTHQGTLLTRALEALQQGLYQGEERITSVIEERWTQLKLDLDDAVRVWEHEIPVLRTRMKEVVQLLVKSGRLEAGSNTVQDAPPRRSTRRNP